MNNVDQNRKLPHQNNQIQNFANSGNSKNTKFDTSSILLKNEIANNENVLSNTNKFSDLSSQYVIVNRHSKNNMSKHDKNGLTNDIDDQLQFIDRKPKLLNLKSHRSSISVDLFGSKGEYKFMN